MARIVIIDDDHLFTEMLTMVMDMHGHESRSARTLATGKALLGAAPCDVVFLDMRLPDGNGLDMLPWLRALPDAPDVILITALGDPESAERAIIDGAWDYLEKPSSLEQMAATLERILQARERRTQAHRLDATGLIGSSPRFLACLEQAAEAAATDANVLITGETGTGKELFARAVHRNSKRAHRAFVTVDCAALSPSLVESELFGFRRGSFTGAVGSRTGLVGQADGGTLFLDEVGELPLAQQKSFLRVLQERTYRPVGSDEEATSDFRLLAATNRDLEEMSRNGQFREDLLFRIKAVNIILPPLRERPGDLRELAQFHVRRICQQNGYPDKDISAEVLGAFSAYSWPGNVRELVNVIERAVHGAREEPMLLTEHLPVPFRAYVAKSRIGPGQVASSGGHAEPVGPRGEGGISAAASGRASSFSASAQGGACGAPGREAGFLGSWREFRQQSLDEAEYSYLVWLLRRSKGNVRQAAEIAELSQPRLYALLRKHRMVKKWSDKVD